MYQNRSLLSNLKPLQTMCLQGFPFICNGFLAFLCILFVNENIILNTLLSNFNLRSFCHCQMVPKLSHRKAFPVFLYSELRGVVRIFLVIGKARVLLVSGVVSRNLFTVRKERHRAACCPVLPELCSNSVCSAGSVICVDGIARYHFLRLLYVSGTHRHDVFFVNLLID